METEVKYLRETSTEDNAPSFCLWVFAASEETSLMNNLRNVKFPFF